MRQEIINVVSKISPCLGVHNIPVKAGEHTAILEAALQDKSGTFLWKFAKSYSNPLKLVLLLFRCHPISLVLQPAWNNSYDL